MRSYIIDINYIFVPKHFTFLSLLYIFITTIYIISKIFFSGEIFEGEIE